MNGFTVGMKRDLVEVLLQCQMSNAVRVIVITGSNLNDDVHQRGAFCAGDDTMGKPGYQAEYEGIATQALYPGHDSGIGTYDSLRHISQAVNLAVRKTDKITIAAMQVWVLRPN